MRASYVFVNLGRVNFSPDTTNDFPVPKVTLKVPVIGKEQTRAAHSCQCKYMLIV